MLEQDPSSWQSPTDIVPFDRLVRLAARLIGAPMSLVCIEREGELQALSWTGLPEPYNSTGDVPLPYLFCTHVLRSGEVEVIADTQGHPRLTPGSAGDLLGVGAYLGIPLVAGDEKTVGVFAVMDSRARTWTPEQVEALQDLAHAAMTEIALLSRTEELQRAHDRLREGEERLRDILESITDCFFTLDPEWRITYINHAAASLVERLMGRTSSELIGQTYWDVVPEASSTVFGHQFRQVMEGRSPSHFEAYFQPFQRWFDVHAYPSRGGGVSVYYRDVTDRKHADAALQESELRFRALVENIDLVFWLRDWRDGSVLYVSPAYEQLVGRPIRQLLDDPRDWLESVHPDDRERVEAILEAGRGRDLKVEYRVVRPGGGVRWIGACAIPVVGPDGQQRYVAGIAEDITEHKDAEAGLQRQLEEKTALLQEVHHRVKNNLQIVTSLLSIQAKSSAGSASADVLRESRSRIQSMALIHEILYRSGNFAEIDLAEYLSRLAPEIQRTFGLGRGTELRLELEPCRVPMDVAVPSGLILNELVGNALKHAFPSGRQGTVRVRLARAAHWCMLEVSDDGVGLPAAARGGGERSVGMDLVQGLVRQLGGDLQVESNAGAHIRVAIPLTFGATT